MDVDMPKAIYVVAVSGGVDSVVLLDMFAKIPGHKLIVAHFDHGIRDDSVEDRRLVQRLAKEYGLSFVYDEGKLGPSASEVVAREARYKFLRRVREVADAKAIVTAHHQDDLVETAIINMIRGTGRRGLSSLGSNQDIHRPLLEFTKNDLIQYAKDNNLIWREDPSNQDTKYLRNHIRQNVTPKMSAEQRSQLIDIINKTGKSNQEIDNHLGRHTKDNKLNRHWLIMLPHNVSKEMMHSWLRNHQVEDLNKKQIDRLVIVAKTSQPNRVADLDKDRTLRITDKELHIIKR